MRLNQVNLGDGMTGPCGQRVSASGKASPVRISMLSWEVLFLLLLVAAGGLLVLAARDFGDERENPTRLASLRGHDTLVESVQFAPDGKTLISCGWDRTVRMWDVGADPTTWGREVGRLPHTSHLFSIATTRDGKRLAVGGVNTLTIWDLDGGSWVPLVRKEGASYRGLAFSPDGRTLALGDAEGRVRLWDVPSGEERLVFRGCADEIRGLKYSPDGKLLAGTAFSGEFKIWNPSTGEETRMLKGETGAVQAFAFAPDGRTIILAEWGTKPRCVTVWDLETGTPRNRFSGHPSGINAIAISPDGKMLASAGVDLSIRLWDVSSGHLKATLDDQVGWVKTVAFAPDGTWLAFAGQNGAIKTWDLSEVGVQERASPS